MNITDINPHIRYARCLVMNEDTSFNEVVPLDTRLFYGIKGEGSIKVKNAEYKMEPHSLLIINAGVPYLILSPNMQVEYIALNFDYSQSAAQYSLPAIPAPAASFKPDMLLDPQTFVDLPQLSEVFYIRRIETLQKRLLSILDEHTQKILYYENKSGHILAQCIFDCIRYQETENIGARKNTAIEILSFIHEHYSEDLTNAQIGKRFGYHPNHVSFVIKRMTGMPLRQYIIYVRLQRAAHLLESGMYSVAEIAEQCGFCDVPHFSKCFKRRFGVNPSQYRCVG